MHFRHFYNDKQVAKAGFKICTPEDLEAQGFTYEKAKAFDMSLNYFTWKEGNYLFDSSIWRGSLLGDPYEHGGFYLCRLPIPQFDELWNLYLHGDSEDGLGAELCMFDKHEAKIIAAIESLKGQEIDKKLRKKLLELKKSWVVERAFRSEKIKAAIDSVLEK